MADGPGGPKTLAQDWVTIWQSELSAAATDRERGQAWSAALAMWADGARAAAAFLPASWPGDEPAGPAARPSPVGPASTGDAPGPRDDAIERLAARVAELERRLAGRGEG